MALWALLALGAAGCSVFEPSGTTVRGRVTSAETGEPVEGIYVALKANGGGFVNPAVAEAETDADGRYEIRDSRDRVNYLNIYFNWERINDNYGIEGPRSVPPGESDLDIALPLRTTCEGC